MVYRDELPPRVRVLVLGGGIHGVGVLHDLASRGWKDVHLVEKKDLGRGTSSKSTKLIHGGLRYLRRLSDFSLVAEGLRERQLLMRLAPDLVRPVEFLFPILKSSGMPRFMVKAGLSLYDKLAGRYRLAPHRLVPAAEVTAKAPMLDQSVCKSVYSFWDGQTDDLGLVLRVAASAKKLGAGISEGCEATRITPSDDGWCVDIVTASGATRQISAMYIVNCLGPWANTLLERSGITPTHRGLNNKGAHLLFADIGLKAGLFLQSSKGDGRIFFVLPWCGKTLAGTTEDLYTGSPDHVGVDDTDIDYLLENCNQFLTKKLYKADIQQVFAGLRWLAVESGHSLSDTSRHYVLGECVSKRGLLITLYGGKLTSYRNLSRTIGDRVSTHFGEFAPSTTEKPEAWVGPEDTPTVPSIAERFVSLA